MDTDILVGMALAMLVVATMLALDWLLGTTSPLWGALVSIGLLAAWEFLILVRRRMRRQRDDREGGSTSAERVA